MTTLKHKHSHQNNYDLSADVEKIKAALLDATLDVKGKAGEIFSDSIDGVKEQSQLVRANMADYVSEKPFRSLGVTLLAGIVIGYLIHK